jgi:predicted aspartyl protease
MTAQPNADIAAQPMRASWATVLALGLVVALPNASAGAAVVPSAAAVLAANRAAVGPMPATGTAASDYGFAGGGLVGATTHASDLATGAFVEETRSDGMRTGGGFDGTTPWMQDLSGAFTLQDGGDRIVIAINEAYRQANLWWRADRGGAEIVYVGREALDGASADHLAVTPRGGRRFEAWFDVSSHMLLRTAEPKMFFKTRVLYEDYRREAGVMVAHMVTSDGGVGAGGYERRTLSKLVFGPARSRGAYARPTAPPTGLTFDGGAASVTVPFRLLNNHVYVLATVNGKGPYTFIVDTGGHTLLSRRVVAEVGLTKVGEIPMSGAGEKTSTSGFVAFSEIAIGGARLHDQMGFATEIYDPSVEGFAVDGMVGFELFRRAAVRLDYGAKTMTLFDPARFVAPQDAGVAVPFQFYDHLPNVRGMIGDIPARLDIDTGSRSELDVTTPTAARYDLRDHYPKGVRTITGWGVGGPSYDYVVRGPTVSLGGVTVEKPVMGLSEDKGGSISDPNYEANVGSGLLKRFVLTFDYAHQRLYLKPIAPQPDDIGQFDRSGMWINAGHGGYDVTFVAEHGPAAAAGLVVGDTILTLDGQAAKAEGLAEARKLLRDRAAGSTVEMVVRHADAERSTTLTLRDQI